MSTSGRPRAALDHLVLAAATLAQGIEYVAELTGVAPRPGGTHESMGTHNALLSLGDRAYLEIIAADPEAKVPARPRFFDLDDAALRAELSESPRLVHWVARTTDIEALARRCPLALGAIVPMSRGDYRWRITIPDDGRRPGRGLVPALIQWDVPAHPCDALPRSGVTLAQFGATHPEPAPIRKALEALGLAETLRVTTDRETRLAAMLRTPRGIVTLSG